METNLCVAGFGGQGVMTLGKFLADATCNSTDKNVRKRLHGFDPLRAIAAV